MALNVICFRLSKDSPSFGHCSSSALASLLSTELRQVDQLPKLQRDRCLSRTFLCIVKQFELNPRIIVFATFEHFGWVTASFKAPGLLRCAIRGVACMACTFLASASIRPWPNIKANCNQATSFARIGRRAKAGRGPTPNASTLMQSIQ